MAGPIPGLFLRHLAGYNSPMRCHDLTSAQLEALNAKLRPMLRYLGSLAKRIDRGQFPRNDELRLRVVGAYGSMHSLHMAVHYLSCADSTGGYAPGKACQPLPIDGNTMENGKWPRPIGFG